MNQSALPPLPIPPFPSQFGGGPALSFGDMMSRWQPSVFPSTQFLPPGTRIPLPTSRKVSKKHIDEATKQAIANMKRSAEYMASKMDLYDLYEDLYYNRRDLDEWFQSRSRLQRLYEDYKNISPYQKKRKDGDWRSKITISPAPICDQYEQMLMRSVFANEQYYRVTPKGADTESNIQDAQFSTARKIQTFFLDSLNELQFKNRVREAAGDATRFGTCIGKTPWYQDAEYGRALEVQDDGKIREVETSTVTRQGVTLDLLNLGRCLVDPDAKHADCQRWEFIGDRGPVAYDTIKARFSQPRRPGPYNVGYQEFLQMWPDGGQPLPSFSQSAIKDDEDVAEIASETDVTYLQVWEYHGRIHFSDRNHPVECVITVVTNLNADDPSGGILVRLQEVPAIKPGHRPYVVFQLIPQAAPLGVGLIEQNIDIIWLLSHCVNLFIDNCRLLAMPMAVAMRGSDLATEASAKTKGEKLYPGKILVVNGSDDVRPFSLQVADLRALIELIQYLERMLEKRTAVSDASRGLSQNRKTATEVSSLQQQAQQPIETALALFKEAFMDPFGRIAWAQYQKRVTEDQTVWMNDGSPQSLTAAEIQTGEYKIEATVDAPQHAKISRAQTILQMLPVLDAQALPMLMVENVFFKRGDLIKTLLRCVDVTDEASVLVDVDEQTKMQLLSILMPQQGAPQQGPPNPSGQQQMPEAGGQGQPIMPSPDMGNGSLPPEIQELIARAQYDAQSMAPVPTGGQMAAA